MSDTFPSAGQVDNLEHTDENHAKKVNSYVWNSGSGVWERMTQPGAATNYKTLVDKATTNVIYIGKAAIGTSTGSAAWLIKKVDKTVTDNVTITFAAAGAFTATWNNRGSETYS